MDKEILMFRDIEIEKKITTKDSFFWEIKKLLVSNEISFGEENYKYFIGYLYNGNKIKPSNYNSS